MGCCHPEQKPEEIDILSFFHKMEKENKFEFNIEKYEENYDIIINLSSNTFKKLKKKQQVRIGFVGEILKNIKRIYTEEKEEKITRRILFFILVLTLTLNNYLDERKESNMGNNNDLQQYLLTIVIKILDKEFTDFQNMKLVLYYLANMLIKLFSEIKDINHYLNIEKYINLINKITKQKDVLKSNEVYPFIKVNLYCLGTCFLTNYPEIKLRQKSIDILSEYYVSAYFFNLSFLLDNFAIFNKFLFLHNINSNGNNNKTINNNYNTKFASDLVIKNNNNNFLSISNAKNFINMNEVSNYSISQSRIINNICRNSFISGADDLSYNNNEFLDIIKTKEYQEIQKISFSFYSFLKTTIQDTLSGKKIFKNFGDIIDEKFKKYIISNPTIKKRNSSTSVIPDANFNNNIFKIISLFLFNKCKTENDKIIILSFLDYISDKIKEEKLKEQYYDILLQLFFLFNNQQMKQIIITLLSHTFIKEIENQNTCDFIEELFGISQANNIYLFGLNKMKIIKHFLINISTKFKEITNNNLKVKILVKLSDVFNKYIKYYNKNFTESPSPELSISENIKYKLKKEEIIHLYQNLDLDNDNFSETKNNYFIFINYIKFFITFSHFLDYNFACEEIFKELAIRKKAFTKLINFIIHLDILSIEGEKSYVNDIIKLVKITLKIVEKNSIECFEDFQILCNIFRDGLNKIYKVANNCKNIDFHFLKLTYTVLIIFLVRLKRIFRLPSSILKIHKDIIEFIKNCNNDISLFLNEIDFELFSCAKLTKKLYQDLKTYLKNEKKLEIEPKIYPQIIDIINSKLFGQTSSLFIFLESQNFKIINEDANLKKNDTVEITEGGINNFKTSIIQSNYMNEITLKFPDEKDSNFSLKKNEDSSQRLNLPKISEDNKDSLFNKKEVSSSEQEFTDKLKI